MLLFNKNITELFKLKNIYDILNENVFINFQILYEKNKNCLKMYNLVWLNLCYPNCMRGIFFTNPRKNTLLWGLQIDVNRKRD